MAEHTLNQTADEMAVQIAVERFLEAAGSYDLDAMPEMFAANATIGIASLHDGKWHTSTLRFEDFLTRLRADTNPTSYTEPVADFTIHVDESHLAFVRADATLFVDGLARRHNIDYFTLINDNSSWKIVNASYVGTPFES